MVALSLIDAQVLFTIYLKILPNSRFIGPNEIAKQAASQLNLVSLKTVPTEFLKLTEIGLLGKNKQRNKKMLNHWNCVSLNFGSGISASQDLSFSVSFPCFLYLSFVYLGLKTFRQFRPQNIQAMPFSFIILLVLSPLYPTYFEMIFVLQCIFKVLTFSILFIFREEAEVLASKASERSNLVASEDLPSSIRR